jgi:ribosomal protein L3 glutamine methyltransferase
MNLREHIAASAQALTQASVSFGHGTTNALDEATWLTLWKLGMPLDTPVHEASASGDLVLEPNQITEINALIAQRIQSRKPAAYLTQEAWLQGFAFYVDERAIVPRSLIAELLVNGGFDYWLRADTRAVLDLCTGNGSLAVICASVFPEVHVDAADLSADALEVARINVERHQLQGRITLVTSDGLSDVSGRYDLILCNPPYVNAHSMATLPAEYLAEPIIALDGNRSGGSDGMDFIRTLLEQAPQYMNPGAVMVLEIGNERAQFEAAFADLEVVWLETSAGEDQVMLIARETLIP